MRLAWARKRVETYNIMFYTRARVRENESEIDLYNCCFRCGEDPEREDAAADASGYEYFGSVYVEVPLDHSELRELVLSS